MALRNRQTKAETAKHSDILKALLKQPDNKICADCKRNDPRWASTNLGVFLCIRCSGVHRGMGVHISRVKSVDLDTWTPEQIENIQKWGNRLANLYWEGHLKPGHQPPDHKVESFIRSKYESKRWALEGPVPSDPSTLDPNGSAPAPAAAAEAPAAQQQKQQQRTTSPRPPQSSTAGTINLLDGPPSSSSASRAPAAPPAQAQTQPAPPQQSAGGGLFDLDFSAPAPAPPQAPQSSKNDILSLFSSPAPSQPAQPVLNQWGGAGGAGGMSSGFGAGGAVSDPWGGMGGMGAGSAAGFGAVGGGQQFAQTNAGFGGFGAPSSSMPMPMAGGFQQPQVQQGFGAFSSPPAQSTNDPFSSASVWGAPAPANGGNNAFGGMGMGGQQQHKQNDSFGDIWGDFK
ncbi:ArfGap-domain-containing protein [Atractiella rhizophila]|nr:ArfGap-domain-containing protein [Atractiella rhizophila]